MMRMRLRLRHDGLSSDWLADHGGVAEYGVSMLDIHGMESGSAQRIEHRICALCVIWVTRELEDVHEV